MYIRGAELTPLRQNNRWEVIMIRLELCDELRDKLKAASGMSSFRDPLYEYRLWWDSRGIKSEGDSGWPLPMCFEVENIAAFAKYWNT